MAKPDVSPPETAPRLIRAVRMTRWRTSPNPDPMRPLTSTESNQDVDSFSRDLATELSLGPGAVATSGDRPQESAASALLTADSISAFHTRVSKLAEASSGISSNPFAAAQSV